MRRDWLITGTIVVVASAISIVYLSGVDRCEPSSSTGGVTCYGTTPWALPIITLVLGIGAAIMVFSIVPLGKWWEKRPTVGENEPIGEWLQVDEREGYDSDFSPAKQVSKARRATRDFPAEELVGREADVENPHGVSGGEPARTTSEERRLRDWAAGLAKREAILAAAEEQFQSRREEFGAQIITLGTGQRSRVEPDEITTRDAAIASILARLGKIELELRPPLSSSPARQDTSEIDSGRAVEGSGNIRVTRDEVAERISGALQAAEKAVQSAQDVTTVREILEKTRASFDAGDYEEAMRQSDRILALLRPSSAELRGTLGSPAEP